MNRIHTILSFLGLIVLLTAAAAAQQVEYSPELPYVNVSSLLGSGARAMGMGGAFIAVADDATAASWNPAGLGQLEKPQCSFVGRTQSSRILHPAVYGGETFLGAQTFTSSSNGFDFLSVTWPFRLKKVKLVPQLSYQRSINYTIDNNRRNILLIVDDYLDSGRHFDGLRHIAQQFHGGLDTVSLSLAAGLADRFNIGVSANIWVNGFSGGTTIRDEGRITPETGGGEPQTFSLRTENRLDVRVRGVNFNIGILYRLSDKIKLGAVYKSAYNARVRSEQSLDIAPSAILPAYQAQERERNTLHWPQIYGFGIAYSPIDQLTLSLDFTSTDWSSAVIHDLEGQAGKADVYFPTFIDTTDRFYRQRDSEQTRFGLEYILVQGRTLIPLRLGGFVDTQYFGDSGGDAVTFFGLTAGAGLKTGRFLFDLAVQYAAGDYLSGISDYGPTRHNEWKTFASMIFTFQ